MKEEPRSLAWWPSLYEPFHTLGTQIAEWFSPASEAVQETDVYTLRTELPGVELADVELTVDDERLTLSGEKRSSREEKGEGYLFSEIRYGKFSRSFRLPADADASKINASMKDGVLTVTLPKPPEMSKAARKIAVSAG